MPTRKNPEPNQDLPAEPDAGDVEVNNDLPEPETQPPGQDPEKERGKSDDARGHNKPEPREDPNTYPDPENPVRSP